MQQIDASRKKYDAGLRRTSGDRYITSDPLGLYDGTSTYSYAHGMPNSYVDPTGEWGVIGVGIGAGLELGGQLMRNNGNWRCINWVRVISAGALGGIGGGIGAAAGKKWLTRGLRRLSNNTKGRIGEGLSRIKHTLRGNRWQGNQQQIPNQRSIADSVWLRRDGSKYYVESKFGTSGLTPAQRAARRALGPDRYVVDRWKYPFFEKLGRNGGGAAGAVGGGSLGGSSGGNPKCGCS